MNHRSGKPRRAYGRVLAGLIFLGLGTPLALSSDAPSGALLSAKRLLDAFNAHDAAAMGVLASPEVEVYYVDGGTAELGIRGRDQLVEAMTAYFRGLPNVRSEMVAGLDGPRFASFRERVRWTKDGKERSQTAVAVLELSSAGIARVWYFPAEADADAERESP